MDAVVMMNRAAAALRSRDDHVRAASAKQFNRFTIDVIEHDAADAAGKESNEDAFVGVATSGARAKYCSAIDRGHKGPRAGSICSILRNCLGRIFITPIFRSSA